MHIEFINTYPIRHDGSRIWALLRCTRAAVFGDIFGLVPDAMYWGFIINVVQCSYPLSGTALSASLCVFGVPF